MMMIMKIVMVMMTTSINNIRVVSFEAFVASQRFFQRGGGIINEIAVADDKRVRRTGRG